jgi:GxxExxY protein
MFVIPARGVKMKRRDRGERRGAVELNALTEAVIGAAIKVHRELGPGLLESAYEACLCFELTRQGYRVEAQKPQPVSFDGLLIDCGYRLDLLVENEVVVENKAVERLTRLHERQLLTYLKLSDCPLGLLINFNVERLVDGVRRLVNDFPDPPSPSATSARSALKTQPSLRQPVRET